MEKFSKIHLTSCCLQAALKPQWESEGHSCALEAHSGNTRRCGASCVFPESLSSIPILNGHKSVKPHTKRPETIQELKKDTHIIYNIFHYSYAIDLLNAVIWSISKVIKKIIFYKNDKVLAFCPCASF